MKNWIENQVIDEFHQYLSINEKYLASLVEPHSGNGLKYLVRINPVKTFDKWIYADVQEEFDTLEEAEKFLDEYETN